MMILKKVRAETNYSPMLKDRKIFNVFATYLLTYFGTYVISDIRDVDRKYAHRKNIMHLIKYRVFFPLPIYLYLYRNSVTNYLYLLIILIIIISSLIKQ